MTTLAQISATFIAITAGFYTTKIISITNDKSRIKGRTKEVEAELKLVTKNYHNVKAEIEAIDSSNREDWKVSLIELFMRKIESEAINNLNDLSSVFESYFENKPDEVDMEIFEEILPEIAEASKIKEKERIEEQKKDQGLRSMSSFDERYYKINSLVVAREPTNQNVINTLKNESRKRYYTDLVDKSNSANNRLTILQELKKIMDHELDALTYPKNIKFGFACFIIFAGLGVFVPLLYNTWDESISKYLILPIENNIFVIILFTIGLTLNFVYIGLELREATLK
jgi:hypothetical protein